jgi:hypothetical protein
MSKRKHDRADGQTSLSISLSEPLKQRIAEAAAAENRAISNWFCTHVEKLLDNPFSGFSVQETPENRDESDGVFTPIKKEKSDQGNAKGLPHTGPVTTNPRKTSAGGSGTRPIGKYPTARQAKSSN